MTVLAQKARLSVAWTTGLNVLRDATQFGLMLILVRLLPVEAYGQFGLTNTIVGFMMVFSSREFIAHTLLVRDDREVNYQEQFTAGCVQALAAIGATATYLEAERKGFSTFELTLELTGSPRLGDPVLVETGIAHLGNSSIRFIHRMSDPADGREFARLSQFGVQLDLDTRRPAALPQALRAAAQQLLVPIA
jgi:acyl-CoA thioesterase FadM